MICRIATWCLSRLLSVTLFLLVTGATCAADTPLSEESVWDESDSWEFTPAADKFTDAALLDLRRLNEERSGENGFVRLSPSGDSFVDGAGKPLRFWGVGSEVYRLSPDEMDRHCRFLAKLGVNLVRLHATVANTREGASIMEVDQNVVNGVLRFIKAAKQNGIYLIISPYYAHHPTPKSWRLKGYSRTQEQPWGAIFIDRRMQQAYKEWTRQLYAVVNPHTGLAIKDDPTVAILQIHNEDSLFFWTVQRLPEALQVQLEARFNEWLTERYGSVAQALHNWGSAQHPRDNRSSAMAGLYDTYQLTLDHNGDKAKRVRDQVQFLAELQRNFYAEMGRYLRDELGCRQLLNATNWRTANDERLKALERWTYHALEIDAENEYYGSDYQHVGENNGYRIDPGHFLVNESCLHKPLELTTNFVCGVGRPFVVTETSWKRPNLYQSEGPFLVSAYQSSGGVDAVCWFVATEPTWNTDPRRLFWPVGDSYALEKWTCSTPMLMGMFPAAALTYRRGDLDEAPVVAHERRMLSSIFERKPAELDDNEIYGVNRETDELKSPTRPNGRPTRAVFLIGRVTSDIAPDDAASTAGKTHVADLRNYFRPAEGAVRSATGQITWNYDKGYCTVDSPKSQGITGFLRSAGGSFILSDVTIEASNQYASVSVVSLDGERLRKSHSVMVQVGTVERLTAWQTKPDEIDFNDRKISGLRIVNSGRPPLRIAAAGVHLTIRNSRLTECVVLDCAGYPVTTVPLAQRDDRVAFDFPSNALYVVLRHAGNDGKHLEK
jgi:hypothetical protein